MFITNVDLFNFIDHCLIPEIWGIFILINLNYVFRMWWWRILVWFEQNIRQPVPNEFEIPR